YVWLDPSQELFALTDGWTGLIPGGKAAILPGLQVVQDKAESDRNRKLAKELAQPLPEKWLLRNVHVVDVAGGASEPGRMVAVRDGKITGIWLDSDVVTEMELADYEIIDGKGAY